MNPGVSNHDIAGDGTAAWLTLTAPGLLLTCGIVALALSIAPALTTAVFVAPVVRTAAVVLLLLHVVSTVLMVWRSRRWPKAILLGLLGIDALLCGVLAGAERQLLGPAVALVVAGLAVSLAAGGGRALLCGAVVAGIGAGMAILSGTPAPVAFLPRLAFHTALSVEAGFAGVPAVDPTLPSFATTLRVETSFAGASAIDAAVVSLPTRLSVETAFGVVPARAWSLPLFMPALAVTLVAVCIGAAASLLRLRTARSAVAAAMVAAGRSGG